MKSPIQNMVVVGGGIIAWWAVVFLKKNNPRLNVTLLHSLTSEDVAETVESDFSYLLKMIGVSVQDLIVHADGNYCGSQAFFEWATGAENYFHSAGVSNIDYDITPYSHWLLKLKLAHQSVKVDDYLLASAAARVGKIVIPEGKKNSDAGLSIDLNRFTQMLMSYAQALDVGVINEELARVQLGVCGDIESLLTVGNRVITGDFFIDVTGADSRLIGGPLQVGYESWGQHLPCNNKKYFTSKPRSERLIPFTASQLGAYGWVINRPLRSQVVAEFICHDNLLTDERGADATLALFSNGTSRGFYPGVRNKTWHKNCLALGSAAVTLDHFSHSSLYLAAVSLQRFVEFWPSNEGVDLIENEFNRLMMIEFLAIRDFHCLHYVLAKKPETPMGELLRHIKLPDSLRYRIELFKDCGGSPADEATLIHSSQWINLFLGFGFWPQSYSGTLCQTSVDELAAWSETLKANIQRSIENAPDYTHLMARIISAK